MEEIKKEEILNEAKDKFYDACKNRYNCGRVWEAWQYGTMTQDDFSRLEEDVDFIDELTGIVESAISKAMLSKKVK